MVLGYFSETAECNIYLLPTIVIVMATNVIGVIRFMTIYIIASFMYHNFLVKIMLKNVYYFKLAYSYYYLYIIARKPDRPT